MKKTIRAVIYIRFSSHRQNDSFSIEYQKDACTNYINVNEYTLIETYIDAAKTGKKTVGRDAFAAMIADAKKGKFDKIIVFSFSRSFRNTRDALNYNHELSEKHGITIESVIEPIDFSNPHGKYSATNLFAMHELQSDIIAAHVKSGMYIAAKQGYYMGGYVPFGYRLYNTGETSRGKERRKFEPCPVESPIVQDIFNLYADGFSLNYIQRKMRDAGIKGRRGDVLEKSTIRKMLSNAFYIGVREYSVKDYEKLVINDAVPPIIDAATWARVQKRHVENKQVARPRKTTQLYGLTGKVICASCGSLMTGTTKTAKGIKYNYYRCAARSTKNTCSMPNVRKDVLENYCLKEIRAHVLNDDAIKQIAANITANIKAAPDNIGEKYNDLKKRKEKISGIVRKIRRDMYENEISDADGREMIREYNAEMNELDIAISDAETALNDAITPEKAADYLRALLSDINTSCADIRKNIFDKLIEKVIVTPETINVYLIVSPFAPVVLNAPPRQPYLQLSTTTERDKINVPAYREY